MSNNTFLSQQLSYLPDEMVEEAMAPGRNIYRKNTWHRILRAAACLAVILGLLLGVPQLLPGTQDTLASPLTITVYAADLSSATTLSPDTVLPVAYQWHPGTNWLPGQPITLSASAPDRADENITFQVTVEGGGFYVGVGDKVFYKEYEDHILFTSPTYQPMATQFTVPNNTTIFWNPTIGAAEGDTFFKDGTVAYADIIIYGGEKIIGYTILRFERESTAHANFSVSMVASVSLSPDNEAITEEYVCSLIQKAKER